MSSRADTLKNNLKNVYIKDGVLSVDCGYTKWRQRDGAWFQWSKTIGRDPTFTPASVYIREELDRIVKEQPPMPEVQAPEPTRRSVRQRMRDLSASLNATAEEDVAF